MLNVFKALTASELNTLRTVCEIDCTQLFTILEMSAKTPIVFVNTHPLLDLSARRWGRFEGSTAWLYDCPHHLSPLHIAETCYDRIRIKNIVTLTFVDTITRHSSDYATPIPCVNNPKTNICS